MMMAHQQISDFEHAENEEATERPLEMSGASREEVEALQARYRDALGITYSDTENGLAAMLGNPAAENL